jgi:NAD(P) transhydrogenase
MRETALFLSGHRQAALYGINVSLDKERAVPRLMSSKDHVIGSEVDRIHWNLDRHRIDTLHGEGRIVDPHTVDVGGTRQVTAEVILIATGSTPFHPPELPFDDPDVDDSDSILRMDRLPESLAVIGGGVIGCEYASMFAALGARVTLIEPRNELLSFLDADMSEALRVAMLGNGIDVRLGTGAGKVQRVGDYLVVELTYPSPDHIGRGPAFKMPEGKAGATRGELAVEKLLFAAGRSGATASLGLEAAGVKLGKRGYVEVDKDYRTTVPSIYAAGDVIGFPALASTSMEQARCAVCHAFGFTYKAQVSELLPYGIYTIPEVSCVGLSEEDAVARGTEVVVGKAFYKHNARGLIIGDKDGMVKLVFCRKTRKLIGAHCIGDRATELVHLGQSLVMLGGTVDTLIEMVFNYPTLSECFKYAAYDALGCFAKADHKTEEADGS